MSAADTKWSEGWRDCHRRMNGRHLRVRWLGRPSAWGARLDGEKKPTIHVSRESAQKAAERRAKAVKP